MLRCPKCGRYGDKADGDKLCFFCGCKLITQDEYSSNDYKADKPTVSCPYCNSTNVKKISGTERAISIVTLGILSKKINKSFKCNNCDGTF